MNLKAAYAVKGKANNRTFERQWSMFTSLQSVTNKKFYKFFVIADRVKIK